MMSKVGAGQVLSLLTTIVDLDFDIRWFDKSQLAPHTRLQLLDMNI